MITVIRKYDGIELMLTAQEGIKKVKVEWILGEYTYPLGELSILEQDKMTESLIERICHSFLGSSVFEDAFSFRVKQILANSKDKVELSLVKDVINKRAKHIN